MAGRHRHRPEMVQRPLRWSEVEGKGPWEYEPWDLFCEEDEQGHDIPWQPEDWGLCIHCEYACLLRDLVWDGELWRCARYPQCDGALTDWWLWSKFRQHYHPEYPEIPDPACRYPLYPEA